MFSGNFLLQVWEAGRYNGLSQRRLAKYFGVPFNPLHGRIYREQKRRERFSMLADLQRKETLEIQPVSFKAAVFDIETTAFTAGGVQDHLICCSILPLDSDEIRTLKIEFSDNRDDKRLIQEVSDALSEYTILIGHYITGFDIPFLNSRLTYHGLPGMTWKYMVYDTYQAARRMNLKADRKSLAFLCDFFGLPNLKTSIYPVAWSRIDSPDEQEFSVARDEIVEHCEGDITANKMLFQSLWHRDRSMPSLPVYKK